MHVLQYNYLFFLVGKNDIVVDNSVSILSEIMSEKRLTEIVQIL